MHHEAKNVAEANNRRGLTLIELLVIAFILVVVIGLMLPGILKSRESSRRTRCQNNLKTIGYGLHNYHDAHRVFPAGALSWSKYPENQVAAVVAMIPFYEQGSHYFAQYGSWKDADPRDASLRIPLFVCPSNTSATVVRDRHLGSMSRTAGDTFGPLTYVLCKGPSDALCASPYSLPRSERGPFDIDFRCNMLDVSDGLSHTIFIGEGVTGHPWEICQGAGCTETVANQLTGKTWVPHQPWIVPHVNTEHDVAKAGPRASQFASTMEPMNKNPVTDTMIDSSAHSDCRSSVDAGPHSTSNFRSNHADGAFFLFGDGSVRFVNDTIDMAVYRGLSTIAGSETVDAF